MKYSCSITVLLVVVLCRGAIPPQSQPSKPSDMRTLCSANTDFAFRLFKELLLADGSSNLFCSPWSISSALAMTYEGARGTTRDTMADTLGFTNIDNLNRVFMDVSNSIFRSHSNYTLKQANRLYGHSRIRFLQTFLTTVATYFDAPLEKLNFAVKPEMAREIINDWVENETEGKVQNLIPPLVITKDTLLLLVNALYFNGKWKHTFNHSLTINGTFHVPGGAPSIRVPMMRAVRPVNYMSDNRLGFSMAEIPYDGNSLAMYVVLPHLVNGINNVARYFSSYSIEQAIYKMRTFPRVDLKIPKFKISASFELKQTLERMGMSSVFDENADFSGMTNDVQLQISNVLHKSYIDVNEAGTEAAAATAVVTKGRSARPRVRLFHLDRPFAFFIRDKKTGTILFMGKMADPR